MNVDLEGIRIPDSKLAREIMELVRETEPPLLFHHSSRVYYWSALAGSIADSDSIPNCFMQARCSMIWA